MDRKQQLEELIELNISSAEQTHSNISSLQDELNDLEKRMAKAPSKKFLQLQARLKKDPKNNSLRSELTEIALKERQGNFAVWRGGLTNSSTAYYLEISQPAFNSENRLTKPPIITQIFEAVYIDSLDDLKAVLPLNPTGLASLPTCAFYPFRETFDPTDSHYQPLYDTGIVFSGTSQLNFFQVPLGGTSNHVIKTQVETNMDQGGSLPYPKRFQITGISVYPDASTPYEDAVKFMEKAWIRLFIGTMDYLVMPLSAAVAGPAKRNPLVSFKLSNPCLPIYPLLNPIELISQQNFRVEINFPTAPSFSKAFGVKVFLHGFHRWATHETKDDTLTSVYSDLNQI